MKTTLQFAWFLVFCSLVFPYRAPASAPSAHTWIMPQIVRTVEPSFPPEMQNLGVTWGSVKLVVKVDKTGKLEDVLVTEYTQRPFADEAIKAVKQWTFAPGSDGTEPVGWVREIKFRFRCENNDPEGTYVFLNIMEKVHEMTRNDDTIEYQACSLRDLDQIPVPRHIVAPAASLRPDAGPVTVDFYIDETGRVRVPVASESDDAAFANAAVDAVSQWQFEPPTCKGRPVLVHASQIFRMKPVKSPSKE